MSPASSHLDFGRLADRFPLGIILLDDQARVQSWNQTAQKLFGYACEDVIGEDFPLVSSEHQEAFENLLHRVLQGDVVSEMEFTWQTAQDQPLPVCTSMIDFPLEEGAHSGVLIVVSDITERKWASTALENTARRLRKLSQMGKSVTGDLEIQHVLHTIIDRLLPMFPDSSLMAILLRENGTLRIAALGGDLDDDLIDQRLPCSRVQWNTICQHRTGFKLTPEIFEGLNHLSGPEDIFYGVVLRAKGQDLGLMVMTVPGDEELPDDLQMLVDDAANWAAIAILNANQHQELQRQLQESRAIMSISQALGETLETDRIFEIIAQNAQDVIPRADLVTIYRYNSEESFLERVASSCAQEIAPERQLLAKVQSKLVKRILNQDEPVYVPDLRQEGFLEKGENGQDVVSLLAVSIKGDKNLSGVIGVQSAAPDAFSPADVRLLKQLRLEAGLALKNANLYQNERTQRQWAEILSQVGTVLTSSVDLDTVLNTILEQISFLIPLSSVHIILIENDQVVNVRELQGDTTPKGHKMPNSLLEIKNIREIMDTGEPLVIPDTSHSDKWEYVPTSAWIKSYMGIPLKYGEKTIGLININSVNPDSFTEGMINILKSLAAYATIAVQNARLVRDLQESFEQEKRMREQLIQSDRLAAMGRMAASIAHEINNPLQGILGCLELAHTTMGAPKKQKKYLDLASSALESLNDIVERILSFQRPLQGTMEHTDVKELIEEVLMLSNKKIEQENITIVLKLDSKMPEVYGIPGQLKQVFLNLTLNAVEAMQPGGVLTISSNQVVMEEPWLQISFSDTGKGISEEELQRLFEPFYSTKTDGSGLGLWVSQNIIDSHRGRITSESKLGEGTTFTIWLPLNPPDDKP